MKVYVLAVSCLPSLQVCEGPGMPSLGTLTPRHSWLEQWDPRPVWDAD